MSHVVSIRVVVGMRELQDHELRRLCTTFLSLFFYALMVIYFSVTISVFCKKRTKIKTVFHDNSAVF
ncbi:hypothetical protein EZS27_038362 [termite gut metagenome]|uniref:Uncharacterized protein n=1 Tax=termite gut metagenome TaxID=433724 RepID=A0A5J4PLG5_9ZZZZ